MADPRAPGDGYEILFQRLDEQDRRINELEMATGTQRARTTARTPIPGGETATVTGFALAAGWNTYATVTVPVPTGKTIAKLIAVANGAALDTTTGGVTSLSARILIAGVPSQVAPGSKDAGASQVNNIVQLASSATLSDVTDTVTAEIQINPLNATAFPARPGNFASITVLAIFTA
ncbi:MAG TPA: hypothetical protein VNJ54_07910 [Plantibacter sp.]|uniref:hypothetical protein n=1 Tax=Plantibacter sp. TaxID=1871045 RepID=UPI002B7CB966|nr:hypothetical protein [Plantibacter sp.]